ncbi:hypothetical protein BHM03_00016462 [Ensete ventricosum]|nr:hypothetical protein BHM03_00016462 [Ensete ventricosum]
MGKLPARATGCGQGRLQGRYPTASPQGVAASKRNRPQPGLLPARAVTRGQGCCQQAREAPEGHSARRSYRLMGSDARSPTRAATPAAKEVAHGQGDR